MSFAELFREARKRDEYWVEDAIVSFTSQLYSIMRRKGMSPPRRFDGAFVRD
jgi:hypothetical protein